MKQVKGMLLSEPLPSVK